MKNQEGGQIWHRFHNETEKLVAVIFCAVLTLQLLSDVSFAESPMFATIAEGFTSKTQDLGIEVAYRMFSAPDLKGICTKSERPFRLLAHKIPIILSLGQWFPLNRLVIVAVDESGRQLQPVPITLEVEEKNPPLLNLRSDMISDARVLPVRAGSFRFRARTICSDPAVEVFIETTVSRQ